MPKSTTRALERRSKAVALFTEGKTFDQIAARVGFANRGTAHRVVTQAFREQIVKDIEHHRAMELARMDELQAELWDLLDAGQMEVANTIVKLIDQRCKLLGLYNYSANPRTLVQPQEGNVGKATQARSEVAPKRQKAA